MINHTISTCMVIQISLRITTNNHNRIVWLIMMHFVIYVVIYLTHFIFLIILSSSRNDLENNRYERSHELSSIKYLKIKKEI